MADDKVKIDIRRVRKEPTIYEKNSLYLISDIGDEDFVLIVTDPEGNPKKIEVEELIEYAKLTDLPETSTLQELLDTVPEDIGKLQTPFRLNEWADNKYALKNHTHIWGDITDRPTKLTDFQNDLENYGNWITENFADNKYALRTRNITGKGSLEGGGDLTQDRTIDLKDETKTDIGLGVEANSWGDHKTEGYLKDSDLEGYATEVWVEDKGYITSYEDTTYTAGEGLDLDEGEFRLTQTVLDAIEEAHTHPNKGVIDDITSEHVSDWDSAFQDSHTHDNKSVLDGIGSSDIGSWDEAYTNSHVHANKSTLDSILQGNLDSWDEAYSKAHTHANKTILDDISSEDISDWNTAFAKSHDHINKSLLDAIGDTDIENWDEAYRNTHTHANKNVLDGITSSDISNWNNKIDEDFADGKYTLNTVEVRGTNGLTGGGALTTNRNIELSTDTKTDISKGVAAHAYTLDDVASNGNSTSVKLTGDSVFSKTLGKDYTQMEDLWKAGFSIQFLSNEYKLVLRRKDDFIISEVDLSSLVSGDLEVSIDDTDPLDPEIVFKQNGVEVGRVPASSLLAGVVRSGELVGKEIHFKDRTGTVIINIDLSPVLDVKADKVTKVSAGTGLSGGGTLAADRTISFDTTWGDDRYQGKLTAGTNVAISASNEISATDTKYTAGNGLTLSGTAFSLPVSITGTGTFVKTVTQSANGVSVVLGTPPDTNTTYSNMTLTELNAGTVTTARSISAKTLSDWGTGKFALKSHTHSAKDINSGTLNIARIPTGTSSSTVALGNHTHTFASLTSKPTTISGYGITDFNSLGDARWALRTRTITGTGSLTGGGNLTANRTLDLTSTAKNDIAKGVTAHEWGDFRDYGLGVISGLTTMSQSNQHNSLANSWFRVSSAADSDFLTAGVGISLSYSQDYSNQLFIAHGGNRKGIWYRSKVLGESEFETPIRVWDDGNLIRPFGAIVIHQSTQDLNTITQHNGVFSLATSADATQSKNYPWNGAGGNLIQFQGSLRYKTQFFTDRPGNRIAYRNKIQNSVDGDWGRWRGLWHDGNFTPSNYYTKNEALNQFVGLSGVQTINSTKTFTSSPVVPNGTINSHAVNLGQLNTKVSKSGDTMTGPLGINKQIDGWSNAINDDPNNYTNNGLLKIVSRNNILSFFGDGIENRRRFGIQSGHASSAWASAVGTLELNPFGGSVKVNGGDVWHTGNLDPSEYSKTNHTHTWAQVSGKPATATRWPTWAEVTSKPAINSTGTVSNSLVQRDGTKINTAGGFFETSDRRLKTSIKDMGDTLKKVLNVPTVSYNMNKQDSIGTIAQDVQEIFPELVNTDEDGMLSVNYAKLSVVAIKAIKELTERVHKLERRYE